jgi:ribulose bisphosphate carboxylase small subunit
MDNHSITTCDGTIYPKTKKELINTLEQIVKDIDNVYISFICSQEEAEREFC